ncbi:glutamine--fructose-6-phosphate transaminase (isomerizing) [Halobellus limi]|uniref:Glutamine--fructose-6-phosphate aminotransferase [isomerizing] n=1 Tax=Halobellus limi TaxID=699433 RepID=A0A1H5UUJ0_9EURY|nr:glutamine--fructose-6-phosphate transaminase (isomerizing) [Halobellus limi]QCC46940.1 glutamine--fructose-6-phosphate transaminase (isomerizing) [Halobellus limi]SEF77877.1 glutamine--fructose-6-phosphate transaminase [Halobellus limi]
MCGIVGYVGSSEALPILATGLKNLEYRGYDSAGIALADGDGIEVHKQAGEIDDLELPSNSPETIGVGHTRWSTHGEPTDANAHPHVDCTGDVAVVHNGIIENYATLRDELERSGHEFTSETDTEVVPHLVEEELEGGASLPEAVEAVVERLHGSYALGVVTPEYDGIVATRRGSPLVVGHGDTGNFIASDVTAFLEHTRRVSYIEDGDIAYVTADDVVVEQDGQRVERAVETVEWEAEAAEKGGYEHYMLKEIHEQPTALRQAISGRLDELHGDVDLDIELPEEYLQSLEEIQIVACGTSYHAGMVAAQLFEEHASVRTSVEIASEYEFQGGRDPWRTLVVAVTQSGETADTLSALRKANRSGARTLAVTNTVGSTATREADHTLYIRAGPEIGVAATKTFASQVATLTLLSVYLGRHRSELGSSRASDVLASVRNLPGAVQQALDAESQVLEVAETYVDSDAFFFIGRELGYPVALEGALKLKEISYDHAEGFAAGELKHGPLALVTPNTPTLAVLTEGTRSKETLNNVKEVESRGSPVVGCSSLEDGGLLDAAFDVPEIGVMEPLVANVYLQLFAYHVANLKGRPIDKPRNLAKSVTVE